MLFEPDGVRLEPERHRARREKRRIQSRVEKKAPAGLARTMEHSPDMSPAEA